MPSSSGSECGDIISCIARNSWRDSLRDHNWERSERSTSRRLYISFLSLASCTSSFVCLRGGGGGGWRGPGGGGGGGSLWCAGRLFPFAGSARFTVLRLFGKGGSPSRDNSLPSAMVEYVLRTWLGRNKCIWQSRTIYSLNFHSCLHMGQCWLNCCEFSHFMMQCI